MSVLTARHDSISWTTVFWAMLVSALWGGNVVALKLGLLAVPPFWSAFWRMLPGLIFVALFAVSQGVSLRPAPGEFRRLLGLGLLFTVQISLLNQGTFYTSPAFAVVLLNSHPIFANLIGHFLVTEVRLTSARLIGLILAFAGVCYVFLGSPEPVLAPRPLLGNLLNVASAVLLGARSLYTRLLVQSIDPMRALVWQLLLSIPAFLLMAALTEPLLIAPLTLIPFAAILYQGVFVAGICFIIWTLLLRAHPAGTLSMFSFTIPFFGVLLSLLLFREPVSSRLLIGVILVTAGILIATRPAVKTSPAAEPY